MRIRGMIFDFNGVIVDDEPLHCKGFQQALAEESLVLSMPEYYEKYLPYDDYNFFLHFLADRGRPASDGTVRRLMRRKTEHYMELVKLSIPVLTGSRDFLQGLPDNVPLVIASGAARNEIEFILSELGLRGRFLEVIAAGDVKNSKPHPEAFLKAFEVLRQRVPDLTRRQVVVFEDSYRGVQAARSAGVYCVGVTTSYPAERLRSADLVVQDLSGWTVEKLELALGDRPRGASTV